MAAKAKGNGSLFNNEKYARQLVDFSDLTFGGNLRPTDIDGFLEWKNKLFVYFELKYKGAPVPMGQRLAYERAVDACKKPAIFIVADHECKEDINAGASLVRMYYYKGEWRRPKKELTVRGAIDGFINCEGNMVK